MRILMVTRGVLPIAAGCGGAELAAFNLARTMAMRGEEVTLLTEIDEERFAPVDGLEIVHVQTRSQRFARRLPGCFASWLLQHLAGNVAVARTARRILREREFDVIQTCGALSTIIIARHAEAPIVYTEQDADPWTCRYRHLRERAVRKLVYRLLNVRAFRCADRIVPVSSDTSSMTTRWNIPVEKITAIPNGFDIDIFNPVRPGMSLRDELGVDRYCLFVGRLETRKGPDIVLDALAEVDDLPCVFAGNGPLLRKLERRALELGLSDRVFFVGSVPPIELGRLYAEADMLVLPSVSEGLPLVLVEAMACAIPVVTSGLPGIESLVDDWENGVLVKPRDTGQLVMAMRVLSRDGELRRRLGENGRRKVLEHFPWRVVGARYMRVFHSLVPTPLIAVESLDLTLDDEIDVTATADATAVMA